MEIERRLPAVEVVFEVVLAGEPDRPAESVRMATDTHQRIERPERGSRGDQLGRIQTRQAPDPRNELVINENIVSVQQTPELLGGEIPLEERPAWNTVAGDNSDFTAVDRRLQARHEAEAFDLTRVASGRGKQHDDLTRPSPPSHADFAAERLGPPPFGRHRT